jgi:hypothetical protein
MKKKSADKPNSLPLRCAIYARTATVKIPSEDNSISHQVATCKRFASGRGWTARRDCIFTAVVRLSRTLRIGSSHSTSTFGFSRSVDHH